MLFVRAQLAGTDGDWRAADSLFGLAAAAKFEDATFVRGRFLSLPSLDPPPAMMRGAMADLRAPAIPTKSARMWAEPFAAMLALRLGDAVPAAFALPRPVVSDTSGAPAPTVRELTVELSARRLLAIGKPDEALAVLLSPDGSLPSPRTALSARRGARGAPSADGSARLVRRVGAGLRLFGAESYSAAVARAHQRLDRR